MPKRNRIALKLCLTGLLLCGVAQILWGVFVVPFNALGEKSGTQEILQLSDEAASPLWESIERRARASTVLSLIYGGVVVVLSGYGLGLVGRLSRTDELEAKRFSG